MPIDGRPLVALFLVALLSAPADAAHDPFEAITDASGSATVPVDFALPSEATIKGLVTDEATGMPLANARISVFDAAVNPLGEVATAEDGTWRFDFHGQPIRLIAHGPNGDYLSEVWEDRPCRPALCPHVLAAGTVSEPVLGFLFEDFDFALSRHGTIAGTVSDSAGEPIPGGLPYSDQVRVHSMSGELVASTILDVDGGYQITHLIPGLYRVSVSAAGYATEAWDDVPCTLSTCGLAGDVLEVVADATSTADFVLDTAGAITGTVREGPTGTPLLGIEVLLFDPMGGWLGSAFTDADGRYTFAGLAAGSYRAGTLNYGRYINEIWDDMPCNLGIPCDPVNGSPIEVIVATVTEGVDFVLEPIGCQPTAKAVCLGDGRFRVTAEWATAADAGDGLPRALTDDAAAFWFFRPDNLELMVKVLDACDGPTERFWVFAAGLTNQMTRLEVTDTVTGDIVRYDNPLGLPFQPVLDTDAFATCGAEPPPPPPIVDPFPDLPAVAMAGLDGGSLLPGLSTPDKSHPSLICGGPHEGALCLLERFTVRATWRRPDGSMGDATPVPITSETGALWFFRPDNLEIVIKVLDNCEGPTERYWVFVAGLTNLEINLEVIDTETGTLWTYRNEPGQPFQPVFDTAAFDTCVTFPH